LENSANLQCSRSSDRRYPLVDKSKGDAPIEPTKEEKQ